MVNLGGAPGRKSKRILSLGGILQVIRIGYSNYITYILNLISFLGVIYLAFSKFGFSISGLLFYPGVALLVLISAFLIGLFHYRKGFFEGTLNVDIINNPYHRRAIPGKEPLYWYTFLVEMKALRKTENDPEILGMIDRVIPRIETLLKGEDVPYEI